MALIKCPECGEEISEKAQSCPHCGHPMQVTIPNHQRQVPPTNKKGHGCLVTVLIVLLLFGAGLSFGVSQMLENPEQYSSQPKKSILAETMELDASQEADILKIFEACGIGEIVSASVFQPGENHTSYHLEDKETAAYKNLEYTIVVWIDNSSKVIESIYFHSQDIYLNGEILSPITAYYVNSADRDEYRVASQLAVKQLLNYPDTAKFPAISGWAFGIENDTIIVQSSVTAKNAFNMESTSTFQVKFVSGDITSLILDGTEYIN